MVEKRVEPHPLDDSPDTEGQSLAVGQQHPRSLWEIAQDWAARYPDVCILVFVLFMDVLVLGPITGYGLQPTRVFRVQWLYAFPFFSGYSRIDAVVLAFASIQVSLTTLWMCFSSRFIVTRLVGWALCVVTLVVVLMACVNPRYSTVELLLLFGWLTLGTSTLCGLFRINHRTCQMQGSASGRAEKGQFGIRELMLLSLLVGALCIVAAVLLRLSYFYYWPGLWQLITREASLLSGLSVFVLGLACAVLCLALRDSAKLSRIWLAVVSGGGAVLVAGVFLGIQWILARYYFLPTYGDDSFTGTAIWIVLHLAGVALCLAGLQNFGLRSRRQSSVVNVWTPMKTYLRWGVNSALVLAVLALATFGAIRAYYQLSFYRLAQQVSHSGRILSLGESGTDYALYVEGVFDDAALQALNRNPQVVELIVYRSKAIDSDEIQRFKQLKHLRRFTSYNSVLSPAQTQAISASLPSTTVRAY